MESTGRSHVLATLMLLPCYSQPILGRVDSFNPESCRREGQNIAIEYRYAESQFDRLPALAADLVRLQHRIYTPISPRSRKGMLMPTALRSVR